MARNPETFDHLEATDPVREVCGSCRWWGPELYAAGESWARPGRVHVNPPCAHAGSASRMWLNRGDVYSLCPGWEYPFTVEDLAQACAAAALSAARLRSTE